MVKHSHSCHRQTLTIELNSRDTCFIVASKNDLSSAATVLPLLDRLGRINERITESNEHKMIPHIKMGFQFA